MPRVAALAAMAVACLLTGCESEPSASADAEIFAGSACMSFVEVFVRTSNGDISGVEGMEKIGQARDLAQAAADRDSRYDSLAEQLSAMYSSMGVSDEGLAESLSGVQSECEPLLPE